MKIAIEPEPKMALTLFAIPKAFKGLTGIIQRNAILSWTRLTPKPEIILMGDDAGTAEIAAELDLIHVSQVERNQYGTPLMPSLFALAEAVGKGNLFAYVNADIILLNDFITTIQRVKARRFMLTGQRWNLDLPEPLTFESGWDLALRQHTAESARLEGPQAMDYFVFPRGTFPDIPPFAIGRLCWDNWMLYKTLNLNIPLIDATESITAIHQNHDYNHHPQGREGVFEGPEARRNLQLLGGEHYTYFMLDLADQQLTPSGVRKPEWTWNRLDRYLDMMPLARPHLKPIAALLLNLIRRRADFISLTVKVKKIPAKIISRLNRHKTL